MKPTTLVMSLTLSLALLSCAEQYESYYLNAREGKLEIQLDGLHPPDVDSTIFRFTGTAPMVKKGVEDYAVVLDLFQVPMGQHLSEVVVYSQMSDASSDRHLKVKRQDLLNTYIPLQEPTTGISIPGPGDKGMGWTTTVEAYHEGHAERFEVQASPKSSLVGIRVDPAKTVQHLTLSRIATIAGRKAEPAYLSFEKVYTAEEFYQKSSEGGKMYDDEGFSAFQNKLKTRDVRKMNYKFKVQYTDGTTREFEFSVRL